METPIYIRDLGLKYPTPTSKTRRRYGEYKCHCGNIFIAQEYKVRTGHTKSCGCLKAICASKINNTHNLSQHPIYKVWANMMQRCYNVNNKNYIHYGGRGILVDTSWHDINNFIIDMYPSYQEGLTLDRRDNERGYSKQNCRWVTMSVQSRNTRVVRVNNKTKYRGVSYNKNSKKYSTQITVNGRKIHLGYYYLALNAAFAYDSYIILHNLEHTLNFGSDLLT